MLFVTALSLFLLSWSGLFLFDYGLRLINCERYVQFADRNGLQIHPFQLRMYTSKYEPLINDGADRNGGGISRRLKRVWFGVGSVVALGCTAFITYYLTSLFFSDIHVLLDVVRKLFSTATPVNALPPVLDASHNLDVISSHEEPVFSGDDAIDHPGEQGLTPILPGVNMPWEHIPIFMLVLIVATVLHELGHSWAAKSENVRVNGFGIFVIGVYPGAFTEMDDGGLKRCLTWSRLRIYTGGIWHNLVLAFLGYLLVINTPSLMAPLFVQGQGVTVDEVSSHSGLYGGLLPGQTVVQIDHCEVYDLHSWLHCVKTLQHERNGRCVSQETVEQAKANKFKIFDTEIHCCDETVNVTGAHICFETGKVTRTEHVETKAPSLAKALRIGKIEPPRQIRRVEEQLSRELSCLNARWVTEQPMCNETNPCQVDTNAGSNPTCIYPALYNGSQLVRVEVAESKRAVLFVGRLEEFLYMVEVSPLVARWFWVPRILPHTIELLGKYVLTLSLALGVLNAMPCYCLDGQYIVGTVVKRLFRMYPKRRRLQIECAILSYGSLLLATNILIGFVRLFKSL